MNVPPLSPFDVLADELGAVAGRIEREATLRITAAIADIRRLDAERELRLERLERQVADRVSSVKDGAAGSEGPAGLQGKPGSDGSTGPTGDKGDRGEAGPCGPAGPAGQVGDKGDTGPEGPAGRQGPAGATGEAGLAGPIGQVGPAGALPAVRDWVEGVHYAGDVVAHRGGTFQALRDTGKEPGGPDWICLARSGANGADGHGFTIRGTWLETSKYVARDVVALNGSSFVARKDEPAICPGEGWQLIASQGKRGQTGERGLAGPKGDRGPAGPAIVSAEIDGDGLLMLRNGDGSTVTCDLYPLLSRIAR